ncbi:MAG: HAMP domain-containing histidine kinase [Candidatus Solibacter usitatus]|nr:HAMP domain-containing histidine kinase [Candidatus Solibacter usitatus]
MIQYTAVAFMLSVRRDPVLSRFSATDRFFAGLRVATLAVGAVWLQLAPHLPYRRPLAGLLAASAVYSLLIYSLILRTRWPVARIYLVTALIDLLFLFRLVRWAGDASGVFVLGFYLLVALHSFYFGRRVGLLIAAVAAVLLVLAGLNVSPSEPWFYSLVRVGFLFVTASSTGLLADRERQARQRAEQLLEELKNTTRMLEQAQKMALIGRLTAGIAHEINNPAAVVLTRVARMLLESEERGYSADLKQDLVTLQNHARRVAGVVQKMLTYSRPDASGFSPLNINEVIQQSMPLIEHRLKNRQLTLNLNLLQRLPRIYGNANRLEEVFVNLLTNAIDASSPGGQIYIVSTITGGPDKAVQVFVSDGGEGISPENLDKIFEPFFTTKPPGDGTGLGLYITYQILSDHRASVSVDSETGKGTSVSIRFPLLKDAMHSSLLPPAGAR